MSISRFSTLLGLTAGLSLTACLPDKSFFIEFETNCLNNGGDNYCAEQDPSTPYCVAFEGSCYEDNGLEANREGLGCVAEMPEQACWAPCGLDDDTCIDPTGDTSSSTGGETETTGEPETDTEDPSTTTGPECSEALPCLDAELPFCVDGMCSTCDASVDPTPDEACASLDVGLPLCVGTECVQCSAEDASACEGTTPLCDDATNTCVGCSFHEECQDLDLPACNIATGACFSNDAVTEVNLTSVSALQTAINGVADGAEHAVVITGGNGSPQAATVDGGKTIAIVSTNTSIQDISGNASPIVTVTGAGSTVFLHRVRLDGSSDVGVSVQSSGVLYADSTQVVGNDGGGIELAAGTSGFLRNCMIGGSSVDVSAVLVSGGTLETLYSSILGGALDSYGLRCTAGSATVRNSIVTTRGDNDALVCPGASVSSSRVENSGNPDWFSDYNAGDASLTAAGQTQFADVAVWELGDPPFDFEGDARPATDGASDFAGADTIP